MSDWADVAWAYVMRNTPVMANPAEYRDLLWQALYVGELTTEQKAKIAAKAPERAKASLGKPTPKAALDEFAALQEQIASIKAARAKS